jgi:hypothetical protein
VTLYPLLMMHVWGGRRDGLIEARAGDGGQQRVPGRRLGVWVAAVTLASSLAAAVDPLGASAGAASAGTALSAVDSAVDLMVKP